MKILEIGQDTERLFAVGDIHGEFDSLVFNLTDKYKISDASIIICGDCGIGFEKPGYYNDLYSRSLVKRLNKHNLRIYCVRGNHDDPKYYDDPDYALDFPRLCTLPSTVILTFKGVNILCIGGAVSTDQEWRKEVNLERKSKNKPLVWWKNEEPEYYHSLPNISFKVDMMISHEAPISFDPPLIRESDMLLETYEKIKTSREYLEKLKEAFNPKRYYYGHYHRSRSGSSGKTSFRCLNIDEVVEIPINEEE